MGEINRLKPENPTRVMTWATGMRVVKSSNMTAIPIMPTRVESIGLFLVLSGGAGHKAHYVPHKVQSEDEKTEGKHKDNHIFREFQIHR